MSQIIIEKDIYLKDRFGVKRREWLAGQVVESYVYHAVLKTNTVVNPEDLPVEPQVSKASSSLNTGLMETKVLPEKEDEEEFDEFKEAVAKKPQPKNKNKVKK